jgi:hypothetical protein
MTPRNNPNPSSYTELHFLQLRNGEYHAIERSIAFPKITPGDIERFLDRRGETDETTLVCEFFDWVNGRPETT